MGPHIRGRCVSESWRLRFCLFIHFKHILTWLGSVRRETRVDSANQGSVLVLLSVVARSSLLGIARLDVLAKELLASLLDILQSFPVLLLLFPFLAFSLLLPLLFFFCNPLHYWGCLLIRRPLSLNDAASLKSVRFPDINCDFSLSSCVLSRNPWGHCWDWLGKVARNVLFSAHSCWLVLCIFCILVAHLLLVGHLLLVTLLHDVLVVENSVRELLLEDLFVKELANASRHDRLLQNLSDRKSLSYVDDQKLGN